jgi:hypothetical protein
MDQISIKTPNPKCRLFLEIDQWSHLGGRCLSVWGPRSPPPPLPPLHTGGIHVPLYLFTGEGGGVGVDEPVRRLEGR